MNLTNFLKQTEVLTAQYSKEQLALFIHDFGRVLPEEQRDDFLRRLKTIGEDKKIPNRDEAGKNEFYNVYQKIRENLKKIDSQEVMITGILNEEYDDWYDDSSEEFFYEDENGIADMLTEACMFVHTCMDEEMYKEGSEIGRQLFFMEILCLNEYGDEEFSIGDLVYHDLLYCDMKQVILDTLYCTYHATSLKKRPEVLFEVFLNANNHDITLESMMQHGDEALPDFQDFLELWITYLGDKTSYNGDRLFSEAISLLNNVSVACKYAEKFVATHPGIYLDILSHEKSADLNAMVSIGRKAMRMIPKKYMMRSKVALKTAEYIIQSKEQLDLLEMCYFVAYESDTSPMNYLRVLCNGYETEKKREELRKVFMSFSTKEKELSYGTNVQGERKLNEPDRNRILMLKFFDGQFGEVLTNGLNAHEALGWTGTFMKQGIALYLLYLYEGKWSDKGMYAMASIVKNTMGFSVEEYQKGLLEDSDANENELFYNVFSKWKSMMIMEADVRTRAIKRIERLIQKRTEGIMNANRRNYYGECAAYIAALGEVQESFGNKGEKQRLMTSYKDKYSRRSAFRAELKGYGWNDGKKK